MCDPWMTCSNKTHSKCPNNGGGGGVYEGVVRGDGGDIGVVEIGHADDGEFRGAIDVEGAADGSHDIILFLSLMPADGKW